MARKGSAVVAVVAVTVAMLTAIAPGAQATRTKAAGAYLGAYIEPSSWTKAGQMNAIGGLESAMGRPLDIDHLFYKWGASFPGWRQTWDIANGRIPMISWRGTFVDDIVAGSQDAWIRARADGLAALGSRVMLRWFGEMDAGVYEGKEVSSPAAFVRAWQHMHDIFENRGATNVEWVWCPNAYAFATGEAQRYYPGDAYVDWICADGYNWAPARSGSRWTQFADIFNAFYQWGAPRPAPLMVGETGVLENAAGQKADWITRMGSAMETQFPEIKALVYFDAIGGANFGGTYDWRVDTSPSAHDAFVALGRDPYFGNAAASDTTAPSVPSGLTVTAASASRVDLRWTASTDASAVSYQVLRNGSAVGSTDATSYSDTSVAAGVTYAYSVVARDTSGNASAAGPSVTVTTPVVVTPSPSPTPTPTPSPDPTPTPTPTPDPTPTPAPLFADDFESGLSSWRADGASGTSAYAHSGARSVRATGSGHATASAVRSFGATTDVYVAAWVKIIDRSTTMNVLRFQSAAGNAVATLFLSNGGDLMLRNDVQRTNVWSNGRITKGAWIRVDVHLTIAGAQSSIEVRVDGQRVRDLSRTLPLGNDALAAVMIGDNVSGRAYDVLFDDVAASTAPLP